MVKKKFYCILCSLLFLIFSCVQGIINDEKNNAFGSESTDNSNLSAFESSINNEISSLEKESDFNVNESKINRCINNSNTVNNNLLAVQQIYGYLATGNLEGMLNMLSDDFVFLHQGPRDPRLPFYNTWYGKEGFVNWIIALSTSSRMDFNNFNIHFFVAENNIVDTSVQESTYLYCVQNTLFIENFHSFRFNEQGKIESITVISESNTVYNTLEGGPGRICTTPYEVSTYNITQSNNAVYYKIKSLLAVLYIHKGDYNILKALLSDDIRIGIGGNPELVPFAGNYSGLSQVKQYVKAFAKEHIILYPKFVSVQNNKANYHHNMRGYILKTGKSIDCEGVLSFQFDEQGKICRIYDFYDTQALVNAYAK